MVWTFSHTPSFYSTKRQQARLSFCGTCCLFFSVFGFFLISPASRWLGKRYFTQLLPHPRSSMERREFANRCWPSHKKQNVCNAVPRVSSRPVPVPSRGAAGRGQAGGVPEAGPAAGRQRRAWASRRRSIHRRAQRVPGVLLTPPSRSASSSSLPPPPSPAHPQRHRRRTETRGRLWAGNSGYLNVCQEKLREQQDRKLSPVPGKHLFHIN